MNYKEGLFNAENRPLERVLKKGAVFRFPIMQSKYLFHVREGVLKIAMANKEGREVIKHLVKAGDFFGEVALLNEAEHAGDYAMALEDSVVTFLEVERVRQWMQSHPSLRSDLFRQVSQRILKAEERLLSVLFKDASTRVCDFLAHFASEFGRRTGQGYEIKNYLTHDDIAKLTDTSRQTVSTVLSDLREQKLIEYNNEFVRIPQHSPLYPES